MPLFFMAHDPPNHLLQLIECIAKFLREWKDLHQNDTSQKMEFCVIQLEEGDLGGPHVYQELKHFSIKLWWSFRGRELYLAQVYLS